MCTGLGTFANPCQRDNVIRDKEEMYRHLSIDIVADNPASLTDEAGEATSVATIKKGLDAFFSTEIRELKCEKCDVGTHAEQSLRILSRYALAAYMSHDSRKWPLIKMLRLSVEQSISVASALEKIHCS
jgi:hypothetical protein